VKARSLAADDALRMHGSTQYWSNAMNWDQIAGNWKQATGKLREKWGKLTDDDVQVIAGKRDQLVGRIQERYGMAKEEAEKEVKEWERLYH
jgi:uncharacterized protein YjbJ (UPF0337 family)